MFAAIAGSYDINNRIHSFGLDQRWRRKLVGLAGDLSGKRVLDVACGTGDLAEAFAMAGPEHVGHRFHSRNARYRPKPLGVSACHSCGVSVMRWRRCADRSVDVVSIAFGLRNVQLEAALTELSESSGLMESACSGVQRAHQPVDQGLQPTLYQPHHALHRFDHRPDRSGLSISPKSVETFSLQPRFKQPSSVPDSKMSDKFQ